MSSAGSMPPLQCPQMAPGCEAEAVRQAEALRAQGLCVEYALDTEDAAACAKSRGIAKVILIDGNEVKEVAVNV